MIRRGLTWRAGGCEKDDGNDDDASERGNVLFVSLARCRMQ